MDSKARKIILRLQKSFPQTYLVGGAVRDMLLGIKRFDIDVATQATPSQIKSMLNSLGMRFYDVGEKFGTIGVPLGKGGRIEITTFRKESGYADMRHPQKVHFISSPNEDALRRDFTINALYLDPRNGKIFDFVGGQKDIKAKKIRFVGNAGNRIKEDPLRMLRAVRLAAALEFSIVPKDMQEIKFYAPLAKKIAGERIKAELNKLMGSKNFTRGIKLLEQSRLLHELLPEVDELKKVRQSGDFHSEGSAFIHTLLILKNMFGEALPMRYAGLFHDIGKKETARGLLRNGKQHISFYGHARESAKKFLAIAKRLHFSRAETKYVLYLISSHMNLLNINQFRRETLIKQAQNPYFSDLLRFRIYDNVASVADQKHAKKDRFETESLKKILAQVALWQKRVKKNFLDGDDVMQILKLKSGRRVGEILEKLKIAAALGKIKTREDAKKFVKTLDKGF